MKTTKKVGATKTPKKDQFTITVTIESNVYKGAGATALEALQAVPQPPADAINTGTVSIEHAGKSKDMVYSGVQLRRLFNTYNHEYLANDLAFGM